MAHLHDVFDDDNYFVIDADDGSITNLSGAPIRLMQGSHNSEQFTFEIPNEIEGHDMFRCDVVEIHYTNIGANRQTNRGVYEVKDCKVNPDDRDSMIFTWLISDNVTTNAGSVKFRIKFACTDSEDPTKMSYKWYTDTFTNITIVGGEDNSQSVVNQSTDVLNQWRELLFHNRNDVVKVTGTGGKYELAVQHGYIYYVSGYHEIHIKPPAEEDYAAHIFVDFPEPTGSYPLTKMGFTFPEGTNIECCGSRPIYGLSRVDPWEVSLDGRGGAIFCQKVIHE